MSKFVECDECGMKFRRSADASIVVHAPPVRGVTLAALCPECTKMFEAKPGTHVAGREEI